MPDGYAIFGMEAKPWIIILENKTTLFWNLKPLQTGI